MKAFVALLCWLAAAATMRAMDATVSLVNIILSARQNPEYLTDYLDRPGIDVNAVDRQGWSLLRAAAQTGQPELIRLLVKRGADVNRPSLDKSPLTPLMNAAACGWPDAVAALLAAGAAAKGEVGFRAVQCAAFRDTDKHAAVIRLLGAAGAALSPPDVNHGDDPLRKALEYNRHKILAAMFDTGANVNARWTNDMTPLLTAVSMSQDAQAVEIILAHHPDLEAKARFPFIDSGPGWPGKPPPEEWYNDRTALMCAAERGDRKLVSLLLKAGARRDTTDRHGKTAFNLATASHHPETAALLK